MKREIQRIQYCAAFVLWLAAVVLAVSSCHGDLDIVQNNRLTASNMWKTSAHVETSTNEIYAKMRKNFVQDNISLMHWGELRVGPYMWGYSHVNKIYTAKEVLENNMTSSSASCKWGQLYNVIDQANAVLKYAPLASIDMTDAKRSWALGQAYFARAYCYFWAVRVWGDVPLNLNPIESVNQPETYPVRAPKDAVYAQIENDINAAVAMSDYLGNDKYLATKDAVNMLKAEFALWSYSVRKAGDSYLAMAEEALDAIGVKSGDSRFLNDYSKVFDGRGTKNKNSAEVVFALQNDQSYQLTGGIAGYFTFATAAVKKEFQSNPVPIGGTQYLDYGDDFLKKLRESRDRNGDTRVPVNLGEGLYGQNESLNGGVLTWPNKYIGDLGSGNMVKDADIIYYRYAQAVMMYAELKYMQGSYRDALNCLNIIARRAYGRDNYYTDSSKEAVLQALVDEYFLEFPCEGVIWWSLIRLDRIWDYNASLKARRNDTNILLWPIHKDSRNKNPKLTQTEGWY
ncbi:MAG: RagB/SusD family nutrient uptake outer membrane protein [Bacteroidales bacterium]|nr:RagB/SusD family nutrient uptake outer membrane protein [Bacteroidales bacterium]